MITNSRIAYGLLSLQVSKERATFACLALVSQRQNSRWMISDLHVAFILSLDIAPKSSIEEQVQSPLHKENSSLSVHHKYCQSSEDKKSLTEIILSYISAKTTISRYNLHIRGGIHQISTQQQTRTTYANEIKKAHALAQPAPSKYTAVPKIVISSAGKEKHH